MAHAEWEQSEAVPSVKRRPVTIVDDELVQRIVATVKRGRFEPDDPTHFELNAWADKYLRPRIQNEHVAWPPTTRLFSAKQCVEAASLGYQEDLDTYGRVRVYVFGRSHESRMSRPVYKGPLNEASMAEAVVRTLYRMLEGGSPEHISP